MICFLKIVDSLSSNINLKDTFPKDFARNITSVFPEVASVKKVWDDQQVHIQIEWAGPDIFINRKKQKIEGIRKYIHMKYGSDIAVKD